MKAAATFLTFGHLRRATIVKRLPKTPTIIIITAKTAAVVNSGLEKL